jgi:proteasome lid subunit RPN8/RPN11
MTAVLHVSPHIMRQIEVHGEKAYPEEGAGFLLGVDGETRQICAILALRNEREDGARHNRFLIGPRDYLRAEMEADHLGLSLLGVFHSHPDHPNRPSEYDREWAQPFFSYIITSVNDGRASGSRSWRLAEDRTSYTEEPIVVRPDIREQPDIIEEKTS